jgi:hypothetical protein
MKGWERDMANNTFDILTPEMLAFIDANWDSF